MTATFIPIPSQGSVGEAASVMADEVFLLPASVAQQRFWSLDQLEPGNTALNMPLALRLSGELDCGALERALNEIVARHEVLRTTFATENGVLVQVIAPEMSLDLPIVDLCDLTESERLDREEQIRLQEARTAFNLRSGHLFKAKLIKLSANDHVLLLTMHHIVCDGWSNGVLVRELGAIYEAFSRGFESPLSNLPIQYGDFALWQQAWLESEDFDEQLAYWQRQLGNELPTLNLPTDFPRTRNRSSSGAIETLLLSRGLTRALKALSQHNDVTPFMVFLAAFKVLLHRYSGQQLILVGSPTANRLQSQAEGLIGAFANTLLLKTDLSGEPSFKEALQRVKEVSLGAYSNQTLPFEKLVEQIKPAQARAGSQLFQVLFIFQTAFMQPVHLDELTISPMRSVSSGSIFDLSLGVVERAEGVRLQMEYNTDLFEAETIRRMLGHLRNILQMAATDARQRISDIPLLTQPERDLFLIERNRTEESYPSDKTIGQLIESRAKLSPDKVAVASNGETVSYRDLLRQTDEMALHIGRLGISAQEHIGIHLEQPIEFLVALLGVLKAGCTAIPLPPNLAVPRTCRFIVGKKHPGELREGITLIGIDEPGTKDGRQPALEVTPGDAALVVYGDGDKGSIVTHRAMIARCSALIKHSQLAASDGVLMAGALSSCSNLEIALAALISGAGLVAVPAKPTAGELLRSVGRARTSVLALPAAAFHRLAGQNELIPAERIVIARGASVSPSAVRKWASRKRANGRLLIAYGTAETGCAAAMIEAPSDGSSPRISRPTSNAQIYLLDRNLQPVPAGVPGEIFISGELIASTSLDEGDAKVVPSIGKKALCTKLPARYLKDGRIEIIRNTTSPAVGFDLTGAEDALLGHDAVLEATIVCTEDHLTAYLAFNDGEEIDETVLRLLIEEKVGAAPMPIMFRTVPSLPLTSQGDVDYDALPKAEPVRFASEPQVERDDQVEAELKEIWKNLLGVSSVSRTDDFFKLGGHSLAAARLFDQIKKRLGVNLPLVTLFKATTIEQLAQIIRKEQPKGEWSSLVALNPLGSKPPLFLVHAAGGNVLFYKDLATRLGKDQPLYGLQPKGLDGKRNTHQRIEDMAAHYIDEIRKVQPRGPYCFGGSSFGGLVAYEMAICLSEMGEEVALVALFDTYAPGYLKLLKGRSRFSLKLSQFTQRVRHHAESLWLLEADKRWPYIVAKTEKGRNLLRRAIKKTRKRLARGVLRGLGRPLPEALRETQNAIVGASRAYCPRTYAGNITLFRADRQPSGISPDPTLGWGDLVKGKLEIHEIPGTHGTIVVEPRVRFLIEKLEPCLERARLPELVMAVGD